MKRICRSVKINKYDTLDRVKVYICEVVNSRSLFVSKSFNLQTELLMKYFSYWYRIVIKTLLYIQYCIQY